MDPYRKIVLHHQFEYGEADQLSNPDSICVSLGRIMICDSENDRIRVFDSSGQFISQFGSEGDGTNEFNDLCGICSIGQGLYIGDRGNKRIQVFDSITCSPIRSLYLDGFIPLAICATSEGLILVTTSFNGILVLNQGGEIVKRFGFRGDGNGQFGYPRGICCNSKRQIVVLDSQKHTMQTFSESGEFLWEFGSRGWQDSQFCYPTGIYLDWEDNLYVLDWGNDRVSIFDSNLSQIQQVRVPKPVDLCLMNGKMVVTNGTNHVSVFSN